MRLNYQFEIIKAITIKTAKRAEMRTRRKNLRVENQHKPNPLMASGLGIEPGLHWWEESALTHYCANCQLMLQHGLIHCTCILLLKQLRPCLNVQLDSICAKVFV